MSASYLSDMENGHRRGFGAVKLKAMAAAWGVDPGLMLLALELDDGITVAVAELPEAGRVFLRELAAGVTFAAPFWEDFEAFLNRYRLYENDTQEGP
jgi:hypothetical protein